MTDKPTRSAIEPDPSSSAQEVRAALEYCAYVIELAGLTGQGLDALQQARKVLASAPPVRSQEDGEQ